MMADREPAALNSVWENTTKLSEDAIDAAKNKATELAFDIDKGIVGFTETRINLLNARDTIAAAIQEGKVSHLPLSIQQELKDLTDRIVANLSSLLNGVDEIVLFKTNVEDLSVLIWKYGFYNLSDQVLGYQEKTNQLKALEVRTSDLFLQLQNVSELKSKATESLVSMQQDEASLKESLGESAKIKTQLETIANAVSTAQQNVTAALASVKQQSEDSARLVATITTAEGQSKNTADQIATLLVQTQAKVNELSTTVSSGQAAIKIAETSVGSSIEKLTKEITDARDAAKAVTDKASTDVRTTAQNLANATERALTSFEESSSLALAAATKKATDELNTVGTTWSESAKTKTEKFANESDALLATETENLKSLTVELKRLELQIKDQIEKAVGFSLFNAFQTRQESIVSSKRFWQWSLFICVAIGVVLGAYFVYALRGMTKFEYAYLAKLSLSLPVIYAISFCNIQYGKERRLEEEYAFKASISVSLNPYQELVGRLVDLKVPEERAKYTDFIIASIETVFESPTDKVYESETKPATDGNNLERASKQLAPILEPLAKIFGHK